MAALRDIVDRKAVYSNKRLDRRALFPIEASVQQPGLKTLEFFEPRFCQLGSFETDAFESCTVLQVNQALICHRSIIEIEICKCG